MHIGVVHQVGVGRWRLRRPDDGIFGGDGAGRRIERTCPPQYRNVYQQVVGCQGVKLRNIITAALIEKVQFGIGKLLGVEYFEFYKRETSSVVFEYEKFVEMLFQILEGEECARHVPFYNANMPRAGVEGERTTIDGFKDNLLDAGDGKRRECYLQRLNAVFSLVERRIVIVPYDVEISVLGEIGEFLGAVVWVVGFFDDDTPRHVDAAE